MKVLKFKTFDFFNLICLSLIHAILIQQVFSQYNNNACSSSPCRYGTCQPTSSGGFTCSCQSGYSGLLCDQLALNPCEPNPCYNFGACSSSDGVTFRCTCSPNYTGLRCDRQLVVQNTDQCQQRPCLNGGTCVSLQGNISPAYACICPASFTGLRCDIQASGIQNQPGYVQQTTISPNPCLPNPCAAGSTCLTNTQSSINPLFLCVCAPNFTGTLCDQPISNSYVPSQNAITNACQSSPCINGGTCIPITQPNVTPPFACVCVQGYTGLRCEQYVNTLPPYPPTLAPTYAQTYAPPTRATNACDSNPCLYGSTCVPITQPNVTPPYACVCQVNYTGLRCDQPVANPCSGNPCGYYGTCSPNYQTNTYTCQCQPNYTGPTCSQMVTFQPVTTRAASPCLSNPCLNGATCQSSSIGYTCQCPIGYVGLRCDQRQFIDLCTTNSCYNGGTCQTQSRAPDQYTVYCLCTVEYTGSRCQTRVTNNNNINNNGYFPTTTQFNYIAPSCQCQNNGVCRQDGTCQCPPSYYGNRCEFFQNNNNNNYVQPSIATTANPCPAGLCVQGTCTMIPQGGASYCVCNLGWTGPRCNVRNYCQSFQAVCRNGGVCVNRENGFSCSCPPSTTGIYCENVVSGSGSQYPNQMMSSNPCNCQNGGTCTNEQTCQCPRGYIGLQCEQDICKQPSLRGPCFQSITRYFYNAQTRQCQTFEFSGCQGNQNNFGSFDACNYNCLGH